MVKKRRSGANGNGLAVESDWNWISKSIYSNWTELQSFADYSARLEWVVVVVSVEVQLREAEHNTAGKWARGQGQSVSHARPPIKSLSWEISLNWKSGHWSSPIGNTINYVFHLRWTFKRLHEYLRISVCSTPPHPRSWLVVESGYTELTIAFVRLLVEWIGRFWSVLVSVGFSIPLLALNCNALSIPVSLCAIGIQLSLVNVCSHC